MSQMPKHMKIKRAQKRVLVKRSHFLKGYPETKSYKPLCKKLQNNNTLLAKALNKEKQECQLLFSQNVALIADVQNLGLACNKRDAVISNILKNAKEMLKMLVSLTGYLTNTIASCQQYAESIDTNMELSCHSTGKETCRRLSTKSPARGIVRPMVSGYTITKPTINLSRINMQHINNSSNLSIIPEVASPSGEDEFNSLRSSNALSLRQHRTETGRTCRMPERLTALQRESDENEQKVSERRSSRHSKRVSGRLSKSKSRLSRNNSSRYSTENFEYIGSPRVKLNDVSKLLQNSQSINVRMLTKNQNMAVTNSPENNNRNPRKHCQTGVIPETPPSDGASNDDTYEVIEKKMEQNNSDVNTIDLEEKANVKKTKNRSSNWEDPLEGPSWLFNTSQGVPSFVNKDNKTDDLNVSNANISNTIMKATAQNNTLKTEKSSSLILSQPTSSKQGNFTKSCKDTSQIEDQNESSMIERSKSYDSFCSTSTVAVSPVPNGNRNMVEHLPSTMNFGNFVTNRRGCFESEDEDDFTLMFTRHPRNMHFDINDLKLPVLEQSALKPVIPVELEPEVTTTLRQISQIGPIPSISNHSLDETVFDQTTVNLPLLVNNDNNNKSGISPEQNIDNLQPKKINKMPLRKSDNIVTVTPSNSKKSSKKKTKEKVVKDPSGVKVVLRKLNESNVNSRIPPSDETAFHEPDISLSPVSLPADNSSDSECNISSNGVEIVKRLRRKRAPISFQEPNLRKKLRRNC